MKKNSIEKGPVPAVGEDMQKQKNHRAALMFKAGGFFLAVFGAVVVGLTVKLFVSARESLDSVFPVLFSLTAEAAFILIALLAYLLYTRPSLVLAQKNLYAVGVAFTAAYLVNIYFALMGIFAVPTMLAVFLIVPIAKRRDAFIGNLFCNFLVLVTLLTEYVFAAADSSVYTSAYSVLDIAVMFVLGVSGGSIAAFALSNKAGRFGYVIKGLIIGLSSCVLMIMLYVCQGLYRAPAAADFFNTYVLSILPHCALYCVTPIILGLLLHPLLERAFNLVTESRLVELTDHNSPLIQRLRTETPGTFNHSLSVASFAEMCASAIGEDPYLARAAAYYHDVGKLENPEYYRENQSEHNLHDELLPEVSAEIIRAHSADGLKLCEKHRIPREVAEITVQHHGTLLFPVFYEKAKKMTDSPVDPYIYSHHGVTPTSKIAAIIMLCDAGEAAIRSMDSSDGEKVAKLLTGLIENRIVAGQFKNCDISLKELEIIKNTIISAYGGLYHKRVQYPDGK